VLRRLPPGFSLAGDTATLAEALSAPLLAPPTSDAAAAAASAATAAEAVAASAAAAAAAAPAILGLPAALWQAPLWGGATKELTPRAELACAALGALRARTDPAGVAAAVSALVTACGKAGGRR